MNKLKLLVITAAAVIGLTALAPAIAQAAPKDQILQGVQSVDDGGSKNLQTSIKDVVNVLLFIIGALAVVMIIFGGIRYTVSGGDSSKVKAAKDTIMYAVVGLIVAIIAYSVVNFVIGAF